MARPFIRKVPAASGATAVQAVCKHGSNIARIEHIGSAHSALELELLIARAHEHMDFEQPRLELFPGKPEGFTEGSYSRLLRDALPSQYGSLGLAVLDDEVFRQLVVARMIEPAGKWDTIRVLAGLGLDAPSNTGIHRCEARRR